MNRKDFVKLLALGPLTASAMKLTEFAQMTNDFEQTEKMPVLFIGHGSPMNGIEENQFVANWRNIAKGLKSSPKAILCISAHWETKGTQLTAMDNPKTIHDFGGFPRELYQVQYPAPGSPSLAKEIQELIKPTQAILDHDWGLDHGAWTVLRPMFPEANIPIIQMSLDYTLTPEKHIELAKQLDKLRSKGVLIVGSGNMVHNLRTIDWNNPNSGYDWAIEANNGLKQMIQRNELSNLAKAFTLNQAYRLSIPTLDHYLPLLYTAALRGSNEELQFFNDSTVMGSISMTCLKIG